MSEETTKSRTEPESPSGSRSKDELGEEMPYSQIMGFVENLMAEPRGKKRAANLITTLARELSERGDAEGLDQALKEVSTQYLRCFQALLESKSPNDELTP